MPRKRNILFNVLSVSAPVEVDLSGYFDHSYEPRFAQDSGASTVSNGDDIDTFLDQSGSVDVTYLVDSANPINPWGYTSARAISLPGNSYLGAHVPNFRNVEYKSGSFAAQNHPITWYSVFYNLTGLEGENTDKGGRTPNLRDRGGANNIRVGLSETELIQVSEATGFTDNAFNIFKVVFNGSASQVWKNGVKIGTDITTNNALDVIQIFLGSNTNATAHIKMYYGLKFGLISGGDDTIIYNELNRRYPAGQSVSAPYADNISVSFNANGEATCTYDENLYNGLSISTSEFRWVHSTNGSAPDLSNQTEISGATSSVLNLNDYPEIFGGANPSLVWYKPQVKLTDTGGNTFIYTNPTSWTRDNITRTTFVGQ